MEIVVLDGFTLNPGDLKWDSLQKTGKLTVYDRTPADLVIERCANADAVLLNKVPFGAYEMQQLPKLKYIGILATGYNIVDIKAAKEKGIIVTNAPGYGTASVVQMTFALMLELCLHVQRHADAVEAGQWITCPDFCFWNFPLTELANKTLGILGFGKIGQQVADVAAAFGMHIIAAARNHTEQPHRKNFRWVETSELFVQSDVLTIHCPLTPETSGLVNKETLGMMKKTAFLINTSRGPIINEGELAGALNNGVIAGAGLDVLSVEPPDALNPLFKATNCIITPHIAWATKEARTRLMDIVVSNLLAYANNKPVNIVYK